MENVSETVWVIISAKYVLLSIFSKCLLDSYHIFSDLVQPLISADGHFFEI